MGSLDEYDYISFEGFDGEEPQEPQEGSTRWFHEWEEEIVKVHEKLASLEEEWLLIQGPRSRYDCVRVDALPTNLRVACQRVSQEYRLDHIDISVFAKGSACGYFDCFDYMMWLVNDAFNIYDVVCEIEHERPDKKGNAYRIVKTLVEQYGNDDEWRVRFGDLCEMAKLQNLPDSSEVVWNRARCALKDWFKECREEISSFVKEQKERFEKYDLEANIPTRLRFAAIANLNFVEPCPSELI